MKILNPKLLKLDKLDQQLYYSIKGDFKTSDELLNELLIERPNDYKIIYNSAFLYLRNGDIKEGMKRLNLGRLAGIFGNEQLPYKLLPDINDIKNKTIVINLEGGFGDNFVGLKFARELYKKGAKIIVLALAPMFNILSKQGYIYKYYKKHTEIKESVDYWLPSMASENVFGYDNYNQLPREAHIYCPITSKIESNKKIKVGVKFRGGKFFDHDQYRSPKIADIIKTIEPFKDIIQFYSLEKEYNDLYLPNWIIKFPINDFCDTANIIQQMDFNISTCTSIAHLSAGLGKKTIIIVPILPYWLWAYPRENNGSWYYENVTLIRQETFKKWENVLQELKEMLEAKYKNEY
jgi:hypothetical protein